jgi:hypothetical protein
MLQKLAILVPLLLANVQANVTLLNSAHARNKAVDAAFPPIGVAPYSHVGSEYHAAVERYFAEQADNQKGRALDKDDSFVSRPAPVYVPTAEIHSPSDWPREYAPAIYTPANRSPVVASTANRRPAEPSNRSPPSGRPQASRKADRASSDFRTDRADPLGKYSEQYFWPLAYWILNGTASMHCIFFLFMQSDLQKFTKNTN